MQIVIDIPEKVYGLLKYFESALERDSPTNEETVGGVLIRAAINGTPLPKTHGRLIDAREAEQAMMYEMCGTGYQTRAMNVVRSELYTNTIIEADEEVERGQGNNA